MIEQLSLQLAFLSKEDEANGKLLFRGVMLFGMFILALLTFVKTITPP